MDIIDCEENIKNIELIGDRLMMRACNSSFRGITINDVSFIPEAVIYDHIYKVKLQGCVQELFYRLAEHVNPMLIRKKLPPIIIGDHLYMKTRLQQSHDLVSGNLTIHGIITAPGMTETTLYLTL